MSTKNQVENTISTESAVVALPNMEKAEEVKAYLAQFNKAKVDEHRNYIVNIPIGDGLLLHSIHVRPYASRLDQTGKAAVIRGFVSLKFGSKGDLSMSDWRLYENVAGEKTGSFFLASPSTKLRNGDYRESSIFAVKGLPAMVAQIVEKIYRVEFAKQSAEPQLNETNI